MNELSLYEQVMRERFRGPVVREYKPTPTDAYQDALDRAERMAWVEAHREAS